MSVLIRCNSQPILYVRNAVFEMIYENVMDNIEMNDLVLSGQLSSLIERFSLASQGLGFDLASYLKKHEDIVFFSELIKEAIEESIIKYPDLLESTKLDLWNFHKSILEYAETVKKNN